jgi:hypothetical protein
MPVKDWSYDGRVKLKIAINGLTHGMPISRVLRYNSGTTPIGAGDRGKFCYDCSFRNTLNTINGGSLMKFYNLGRLAVGLSFLLFGTHDLASPQAVNYHLLKKVPLAAAPGGAEYFDYITNSFLQR